MATFCATQQPTMTASSPAMRPSSGRTPQLVMERPTMVAAAAMRMP